MLNQYRQNQIHEMEKEIQLHEATINYTQNPGIKERLKQKNRELRFEIERLKQD